MMQFQETLSFERPNRLDSCKMEGIVESLRYRQIFVLLSRQKLIRPQNSVRSGNMYINRSNRHLGSEISVVSNFRRHIFCYPMSKMLTPNGAKIGFHITQGTEIGK